MYKYITIAHNTRQVWSTDMYIYKNNINNKYYISRTYPMYAKFSGELLSDPTDYNLIDFAKEITEDDINKGKTFYWNQEWTFKL